MTVEQVPPRVHGAVLLTNTTVVETVRLLESGAEEDESERAPWRMDSNSTAVRRISEYITFAEAVVLSNVIYTLPAHLPPAVESSDTLRILRAEGILEFLPPSNITNDALAATYAVLGDIGNNRVYSWAVASELGTVDDWATESRPRHDVLVTRAREDSDLIEAVAMHGRRYSRHFYDSPKSKAEDAPSNFDEFLLSLREHLESLVSPSTDYVASHIRNVFYCSVAERLAITYSPDRIRSEWTRNWLATWREGLLTQVYNIVADAFLASVQEVIDENEPIPILLPPISATAAERAGDRTKILDALLGLRREFAPIRRNLSALEAERHSATTIASRKAAKKRIGALLEATAKRYGTPHQVSLDSAIGYAGDLANVIAEPYKPEGYTKLAKQGGEAVRRWWTLRPLFRLGRMVDHLEHSKRYFDLASILIGRELDAPEREALVNGYR